MRVFLGLALLVCTLPLALRAQTPSPTSTPDVVAQRLERLKEQLAETRRRMEGAEEKEVALLAVLNDIGREMAERAEELDRIEEQVNSLVAAVEAARGEIELANARIDDNKGYLRKRLRSVYMFGRVSMLEVLFSARSYSELVRRARFHSALAAQDAHRIDTLNADVGNVERRKHDLDLDLTLLRELGDEARMSKQAIALQFEFRASLLASVRGERGLLAAAARQIEEAQVRLATAMLAGVPDLERLVPQRAFRTQKGSLLTPATGNLLRNYGRYRHPETGQFIFHHGLAIYLEVGSEVRAVAVGRVVKAEDWFPGYGRMLLVDHGDRFHTLYAHNSRLHKKVGDAVSEGELIASSGDTASLIGPNLYFAIFHDGKALNPNAWLVPAKQ